MLSAAPRLLFRRKLSEEERLLRLFWNRAELKREFAKLRRERDRMVDLVRQQEGATLRVQQRLDQLEAMLADPVRAANAAVFFQLRGLWQHGRRRLTRLAGELRQQAQALADQGEARRFEEHRQAALAAIEQRVAGLRSRDAALAADLAAQQAHLAGLTGFWHAMARRRAARNLGRLQSARAGVQSQLERYQRSAADKRRERPPGGSVSVAAQRDINLRVIALAEELLLHFNEHGMASLAREASIRNVHDAAYGSIADCQQWSQRIHAALHRFDALDDLALRLDRRARYLGRQARYRREEDTVPVAGTCGAIPWSLWEEGGEIRPEDGRALRANVLADEYWDIYGVLVT